MVYCIYQGVTCSNSQINIFLKMDFVLANNVDPDEMSHYAGIYLRLHCLS